MRTIRILTALVMCVSPLSARAAVDLDADGVSDIWRLKYNLPAGAHPASGDADGDGISNAKEAAAGTNPLAASDVMQVRDLQIQGSDVVLTWPSVTGKRYKVQRTTDLTNTNGWQDVSDFLYGNDANLSHTLPAVAGSFYRISVYDRDTDGDGVTDWEEAALGLDPESTHSHGLGALGDLAWVTAGLNAPSIVTITAPPGGVSENTGYPVNFTIHRSGGLAPLTIQYTTSGPAVPGADYIALTGSVTLPLAAKSVDIPLSPLTDAAIESSEAVVLTITPDTAYTVGVPATAAMLIHDQVQTNGTGLFAQFWNEISSGANQISTTNPAKFSGTPVVSRVDATVDYIWPDSVTQGVGSPAVGVNTNYFSSRWTGEILPEFSQVYTISLEVNLAGRVWVNGQLLVNNWPPASVSSNTYSGVIPLEGGRRYPIIVEQYETTGSAAARLRWQSANRPNEIIPTNRMFPNTPPQITSALEAYTFIAGPAFNYQITASANPTSYSAANLPPGVSINTATGLISGSPTVPGEYQVALTATNAVGSGSAIFTLHVLQAGGGIGREVWNGITGSSVAAIPTGTAPSSTSVLTALQGPTDAGENYGARVRGYITAPATGVYQFWLAADEAAQLWIADDEQAVNSWKRAELTAPIAPLDWANAAKTPLLYLEAGKRYYVEVLHKEASGADHFAVGWSKPGQPTTAPSEVVPGYVLTQYTPPAPISGTSTLFVATMTAQSGAITAGSGSSSMQMSADKTQATVRFSYSNLTGGVQQKHVHSGADGGLILFDMDVVSPNADGSYTWPITAVNGVSDKDNDGDSDAADVVRLIENGDAYINLHTAIYPAGEIKGFYRIAAGSQTFTPPAAPPTWADDSTDPAAASRFLQQATFGGSPGDIAEVQALGYEGWINAQFNKPVTRHYPYVFNNRIRTDPNGPTYPGTLAFNSWWQQSVTGSDQLRQRVAFALSQILVVSEAGPLDDQAHALSDYYDMLLIGHLDPAHPNNQVNPVVNPVLLNIPGIGTLNSGAFGNFRDVLLATTLHPAMGRYLDMVRNDKPDITTGRIPNENYAREILQLFSLGLNRLHPDASLILDSQGLPIPTYNQDTVIGLSHVFTGWDWNYTGTRTTLGAPTNYLEPMREVPARHYIGQKRMLNNVVFPGLTTVGGQPINPDVSHTTTQINDPAYQALAAQELIAAHDQIFNHPNIGPFICRQLIQRMVTSTPSRAYIYRVVQKFNDNGSGVRGDMKAVIKAILLDYEARSQTARQAQGYGKQREPLLRVAQMARAFSAGNPLSGTWEQDGGAISIITSANHRISSGQTVFLEFGDTAPTASGTPLVTSGGYAQSTIGGVVPFTATQFGVRPRDAVRGSYAQSASTTVTITTQADHNVQTGHQVYVRFRDGGLDAADGLFSATRVSATVFTIQTTSGTATGACDVSYLRGGYSMAQPSAPATTGICTIQTATIHGLQTGASVYIDFTDDTTGNGSFGPVDGLHTITVTSPTSFTVEATYPAAAPANTGTLSSTFNGAAAAPVLNRGGHASGYVVKSGYSDWGMGDTDTDLAQTPLKSPTVFNFFLPDYQYPGALAAAGLVTPEFELTSDTTVVRQANFLYNGLFNPSYTTGLSSFRSGAADIALDIGPWMSIRTGSATPWTDNDPANASNDNLRNLIREIGTLLLGAQISSSMENEIYNFITFRANPTTAPNTYTNIPYTNGSTATYATANTTQLTHRRDRLRAIIHFIVTSPEYTIQK